MTQELTFREKVNQYNESLCNIDSSVSIIEYINNINNLHRNPIELWFVDDLMSYVLQDECVIPHTHLVKYGVLSDSKHNISVDTKRLIKQLELIENEDYRLCNVAESVTFGGCTHKVDYFFHPRAFGECLSRAKNTRIYSKYFSLLNESIKAYDEYQKMSYRSQIDILVSKLDQVNNTLTRINAKLDLCINNVTSGKLIERLILLQHKTDSNEFYAIRAQNRNKYRSLKNQHKKGFEIVNDVVESSNIPSSVHLFNAIRDTLLEERRIITYKNNITLRLDQIGIQEFIDIIKTIFDQRKRY